MRAILFGAVGLFLFAGCAEMDSARDEARRGSMGKADRWGSCVKTDGDYCGGKSNGTCWCNESCVTFKDCCDDYEAVCVAPAPSGPFAKIKQLLSSDAVFKMPPAGTQHGAAGIKTQVDVVPIVDYDAKAAIRKAVNDFVKDFYVEGDPATELADLLAVVDGDLEIKKSGVKTYLLDTLLSDQVRASVKAELNSVSYPDYILIQFVDYGAEVDGGELVLVVDSSGDKVLSIQVDFSYYF